MTTELYQGLNEAGGKCQGKNKSEMNTITTIQDMSNRVNALYQQRICLSKLLMICFSLRQWKVVQQRTLIVDVNFLH